MTGMASWIIHSGWLPESRSISTVFRRLMMSFWRCFERVDRSSSRNLEAELREVQAPQHLLDGFGAHVRVELRAVLGAVLTVLLFGEELLLLERGVPPGR